jgi:hypothetical protein
LRPSKKELGIFLSINAKLDKNTTVATKNFGQFFQQHLHNLGNFEQRSQKTFAYPNTF